MLILSAFSYSSIFAQNEKISFEVVNRFYSGIKSLTSINDYSTGNAFNIECSINECAEGGNDCTLKSEISLPREFECLFGNRHQNHNPISLGPYMEYLKEFTVSTKVNFAFDAPRLLRVDSYPQKLKYDVYTVNKVYQWNGVRKELIDTIWVNRLKGYKISGVRNEYGGSRKVSINGLHGNNAPSPTDIEIQVASMYSNGNQQEANALYKKWAKEYIKHVKKSERSKYTSGVSLNYDQNFQLGLSYVRSYKCLMLGIDVGANLDSKKYHFEKMVFGDILNYNYDSYDYDPWLYCTLTPSFYYDFLSVGCGFGFVYLGGDHFSSSSSALAGGKPSYSSSNGEASLFKFMIRPQIKGYIPITEKCKLSIGVGYDVIPGFSNLNGINASLGFHWDVENWKWLILD